MKFIELSKIIKNQVDNVYLIDGKDRFLCYKALDTIKSAVPLTIDMNYCEFTGGAMCDILASANEIPFIDDKKLIIVKDYFTKQIDKDQKLLKVYLKDPSPSTVLVFLSSEGDFFKPLVDQMTVVDCNELDMRTAVQWIVVSAKKRKVQITVETAQRLYQMCAGNMSRVSTELEKLISYVMTGEISIDTLNEMVVADNEYNIFQLTDEIANRNQEKAMEIIYKLCDDPKNVFFLQKPLYSHFRRLLYVNISTGKTKSELASLLGIKEYAIQMSVNQSKKFTPRILKKIVDILYNVESDIKLGKIEPDNAIKIAIINILKIRG